MKVHFVPSAICGFILALATSLFADETPGRVASRSNEEQLPFAMHSKMEHLPRISVGWKDADLIGTDNRALQAAVDYIAALGGGMAVKLKSRQMARAFALEVTQKIESEEG